LETASTEPAKLFSASRLSLNGLNLIKISEGLRLSPYLAPEGKWTIGYGHLIKANEPELLTGAITEQRAANLLREDVRFAEQAIAARVTVPLTQAQFDALVSFTFNLGAGAFANSTLRRKVNAQDYYGASLEFDRWVYATVNGVKTVLPGLVTRRAAEAAMFRGDSA